MLSKESRLTKNDFNLLGNFEKKTFSSDSFTLKVYFSGFSPSRFAVVLSSKMFKKAVERNKKKRHIKSLISKNLNFFQDGLAVVIYPKKKEKEETFWDVEKKLKGIFKKSKILD